MSKRLVSVIFEETTDERGNATLRKVTTSQWVTVSQIAATLQFSKVKVYDLILNQGAIPYYRFKFQIRVKVEDFLEYVSKAKGAEYERADAK